MRAIPETEYTSTIEAVEQTETARLRQRVAELEHMLARRTRELEALRAQQRTSPHNGVSGHPPHSTAADGHRSGYTVDITRINAALEMEIAERKRVEAALHQSQHVLQSILENSPMVVTVKDSQGRYILVNSYAARLLQRDPDELIGKTVYDLFSPERAAMWEARDSQVFATGQPVTTEVIEYYEQETYTFLDTKFPLFDAQGHCYAVGSIAMNITEQVQIQEAYRTVVEHSLQGLIIFQDRRYVFVNPMMQTITGYSVEELLAFSPEQIVATIHPDDRAMVLERIKQRFAGQDVPLRYDSRIIRKDGTVRWVEVYSTLIRYHGRTAAQTSFVDITERKRMEETLHEFKARYERAVTAARVGVWDWNLVTNEIYLAPELKALLGYADDEIRNHMDDWAQHVYSADLDMVMGACNAHLRGETPIYEAEHRMVHKDGSERWFIVRATAIRDEQGLPIRMVGTDTDITALKHAEQAYRTLVDHSLQGLVIIQDDRVVFANATFAAIVGYTLQELDTFTLQELHDMVHPDDYAMVWQRYQDRIAGKDVPPRYQFRGIRKDGQVRLLEMYVTMTHYHGRPAFQTTYLDITERKQAEDGLRAACVKQESLTRQLRRNNDLLRTLFDQLHDGLVLLNQHGFILAINQAVATILGLHPDALVNANWVTLCRHTTPPFPAIDLVEQTLQDGKSHRQRERYEGPGHQITHILDIQTLPIASAGASVEQVVIHIVDVTDQLTMEAIAIQNERLAATGTLAANVAHEINTPLQSINHCLFLLYDTADPQHDTYVTMAREEITRIGGIVRQLLDMHRSGSATPAPFSINPLVERVIMLTSSTLKRQHITLHSDLSDNLPQINGYSDQITQVLLNLILNARHAMPDGGEVLVRTLSWWDDAQQHGPDPRPSAVVVEIEDSGTGISQEVQAHIFDPFFTTRSNGTGLGLTISQKIMSQHRGYITVQSEVGRGSCFRAVFSLSDQCLGEHHTKLQ
jgi:PAS domain S-box-containing protein